MQPCLAPPFQRCGLCLKTNDRLALLIPVDNCLNLVASCKLLNIKASASQRIFICTFFVSHRTALRG